MQPATEDFWLSYLRTSAAVQERDLAVRAAVQASAEQAISLTLQETEAFQKFLLSADAAVRQKCVPFLDLTVAISALAQIWRASQAASTNENECHQLFRKKILEDEDTTNQLRHFQVMLDEQSDKLQQAEEARHAATEIAVTLEAAAKADEARKKRTWRDVPEDELADRLSKGEIIGRDEWIPGLTGEKRDLAPPDAKGHLLFGRQIREEGNNCFAKKDFQLALLRYTQGVNLLNWVKCDKNAEIQHEMDQLHLNFLKNQAQAALQCEEWQQAKASCDDALKIDPYDEKSFWRLAKAQLALGELTSAKDTAMRMLKSPFVSADGVLAGKGILQELRAITANWKRDMKNILPRASEANTFSSDRKPLPSPPLEEQTNSKWRKQMIELKPPPLLDDEGVSMLDRGQAKALLEELLELYTSPAVETQLNALRRAADFEERRILIRSRAVLPEVLGPFLEAWKFPGETYVEQKKAMEKEIFYWRARDEEVRELASEVYSAFLGETVD